MSRPLSWPHIHRRSNAGGSITYVVDAGLVPLSAGITKRERYYFKTKKAADEKAVELRTTREQFGSLAAQKQSQTSAELTECLNLLAANGIGSLKEAVQLAINAKAGLAITGTATTSSVSPAPTPLTITEKGPTGTITTEEVINEYIAARIEAKKGESETDHEKVMNLVMKKALKPYLKVPIRTIDVAIAEKILNEGTKTRATRGRWVSTLNQLFNYAAHPARAYLSQNPVPAIVQPLSYGPTGVDGDPDKGPVHILSANQMTRLLRLAETDVRFSSMIMPIAAQAFLTIRRCEARRFQSFQLNSEIRLYDVVAKRTRSRKNREVMTNSTFDVWRRRYWKNDLRLFPENYADMLRKMVSELGLKWTRNTIRHTAASNYLVAYGEEATVKQLGHRDSEMLYKHYRRKVSNYENDLYWAILPLENAEDLGTLADPPLSNDIRNENQQYGSI